MPDPGRQTSISGANADGRTVGNQHQLEQCVIDSTAYFIRTELTPTTPCKEILIFGDVEPDSISLSPRTALVWAEAAPKVAAGILTGVFIECSYTNAQSDAVLYGHLSPRHLLAELQSLADMVKDARREHEKEKEEVRRERKRKRVSASYEGDMRRKSSKTRNSASGIKADTTDDESMPDYVASPNPHATVGGGQQGVVSVGQGSHTAPTPPPSALATAALNLSSGPLSAEHSRALMSVANDTAPLKGLKVVIIHVKDTLADGPLIGESILRELREGERALAEQGKGLGCEFEVSRSGDSYWF
jgi:elongation factor 1-gamma